MNNVNISNILMVVMAVIIVGLLLFFLKGFNDKKVADSMLGRKKIEYELNGKKLNLVVAENAQEWHDGLMFVRKPVEFDGMIFRSQIPSVQVFWNKNTYVDLDIYWLRKDKVIGESFLPSIESGKLITVTSPGVVDTIIEVIR